MRWEVAPKLRFDLIAFAGLNLSGERRVVEFHAMGGRQGDLQPEDMKSVAIVGPMGLRVVFKTSDDPEEWQRHSWRCVRLLAGHTFTTKEGRPGVRIPDLDLLNAPDARRTDPDFEELFEEAAGLEGAKGWTFGHAGRVPLKANIRAIQVDLLP
jgi:hypothetical protein